MNLSNKKRINNDLVIYENFLTEEIGRAHV